MLYDLYMYVHSALNLHFWDVFTIVAAIAVIAVWAVHIHNQKKRSKEFDQEMEQEIEELKAVNS